MKDGKKAAVIGVTCILTYIANYYLRNILGVLTPALISSGVGFTYEHIANLSSIYMLFYAAGQLVNGILGDIVSPKYLVGIGLFVAGGSMVMFPYLPIGYVQIACFAILGFALSMLRGPLMKIISENAKPNYARLICVFFSFAGCVGPFVASLFAMINGWNLAFVCAGAIAVVFGLGSFIVFTVMEKKGLVSYMKTNARSISSILAVFKIENIVFYIIIAGLVEISFISINQWMTTFLTGPLGFDKENANMIYSGISFVRALMPFMTLAIFRAIKEKDLPIMRVAFTITTISFALLIVSPGKWFSVAFLLIALCAMACTSALLWSIYIPSLGKTGRVSSVNGVIDCLGYVVAAGANWLFAEVMTNIGWTEVYLLWASMGIIGLATTFIFRRKKAK